MDDMGPFEYNCSDSHTFAKVAVIQTNHQAQWLTQVQHICEEWTAPSG